MDKRYIEIIDEDGKLAIRMDIISLWPTDGEIERLHARMTAVFGTQRQRHVVMRLVVYAEDPMVMGVTA